MSETQKLLEEIEDCLIRTGMAPSTFGHYVVNDGKLVDRLRAGRTVTLDNGAKIRSFIKATGSKKALERWLRENSDHRTVERWIAENESPERQKKAAAAAA